jgi:hypothetical protein
MVTCVDSVAASSSADQGQLAHLSVTRDEVSYYSGQGQLATVDNGEIEQTSMSKIKVVKDKDDNIKKVKVKLREVQEIDSSSTDDSTNAIDSNAIDLREYQEANIATTKDSADIGTYQSQQASMTSNGVIKQKQVTVITVKFTKEGVKTTVKMKQKQKAK